MKKPLTMEQARALGAALAARHGARILHPEDTIPSALRAALVAAKQLAPAVEPIARAVLAHLDRVSVTLPMPGETWIILSPAACADPVIYLSVVAHELQHAVQIERRGRVGVAVDYLLSSELRADQECEGYGVGLTMRWLMTGDLPSLDAPLASLSSGTYHLDAADLVLSEGLLRTYIDTMAGWLLPNLTIAVEAYRWLKEYAADTLAVTLAAEPA